MIFWFVSLQHILQVQKLVAELRTCSCCKSTPGLCSWEELLAEPVAGCAAGNQVVFSESHCPHTLAFRSQSKASGLESMFFPLFPGLELSKPAGRSPAAAPRVDLWLCPFAGCEAVAVAALCIANRICLCPAVLVGLMIRGFLIFSWDDAA